MTLRTPNRKEAEARAADHIASHKLALLAADRVRRGKALPPFGDQQKYPKNTSMYIGDYQVIATDSELIYLDNKGFHKSEPNVVKVDLRNAIEVALSRPNILSEDTARHAMRLVKSARDKDEAVLETWIAQRGLSAHIEREARVVWEDFKRVVAGKPLSRCRRDDARILVQHLAAKGNATKTIEKKLSHLIAACNLGRGDDLTIWDSQKVANQIQGWLWKVGYGLRHASRRSMGPDQGVRAGRYQGQTRPTH